MEPYLPLRQSDIKARCIKHAVCNKHVIISIHGFFSKLKLTNSASLYFLPDPFASGIFTQSIEGDVWTVPLHRQTKFWTVWTAERSKRPGLDAGPCRVLRKTTP